MSAKHPIIAVTGSSGAGTTSVTRTFNWIFRRERINAVLVEGDSFHRYDRLEMKRRWPRRPRAAISTSVTSGPPNNLFEELEALFRGYGESRTRQDPPLPAQREGSGSRTGRSRAPSPTGRTISEGTDLLVLRRTARRRGDPGGERRTARRSHHRRGAHHQPRMDPEAAPRPRDARLLDRGGGGHGPAPHARLRELHLPAILADPHQFPARAHGGYLQSLHCALHSDGGRELRGHPLQQPEGDRFSVSSVHDSRLVHVAAEYHRVPGRKDGARDAAHPDADDLEAHGCAPPRPGAQPARVPIGTA